MKRSLNVMDFVFKMMVFIIKWWFLLQTSKATWTRGYQCWWERGMRKFVWKTRKFVWKTRNLYLKWWILQFVSEAAIPRGATFYWLAAVLRPFRDRFAAVLRPFRDRFATDLGLSRRIEIAEGVPRRTLKAKVKMMNFSFLHLKWWIFSIKNDGFCI